MKLLVTAGPTREPLDPVRFLSNASSGRMGYAIAAAAAARGHDVLLVSGPVALDPPAGVTPIRVTTAMEMLDACCRNFADVDALVMTAAVCDYRPAHYSERKLKKDGDAERILKLVPNPDVLATLTANKTRQVVVGFALETDDAMANAKRKLAGKRCDAMVLNTPTSIGSTRSAFTLLTADGRVEPLGTIEKTALAERLIDLIESLLPTKQV
jgi:phosphopantothenoylcysteine decarboxylase/phosphopantothenate--cysteine ligase